MLMKLTPSFNISVFYVAVSIFPDYLLDVTFSMFPNCLLDVTTVSSQNFI